MADSARIFISYHRSDTPADAGRLSDTLQRRLGDERVFMDVSSIEAGANWERVVDRTLQGSVAVLLVIGPAWTLTESIRHELRVAFDSGVAIIPTLVRGANWLTLTHDLPSEFLTLRKLNAFSIDHNKWRVDIEPLVGLLERMLANPAQARVICTPPEPVSVLRTTLDPTNLRSLLVHAADLAECLDDASVLAEAQQVSPKSGFGFGENLTVKKAPPELLSALGIARYRLMMEQIGRDLLEHSPGERVAQYLQDPALEQEIRSSREDFEEEVRKWHASRGDDGEPASYQVSARETDARARDRLREQLPGLTKQEATRDSLFRLMEKELNEILSRGRLQDYWEYTVLKHFNSCRDLPFEIIERARPKACEMLESFEASNKATLA